MTDYFADDPRTNYERMLAGEEYIADEPEFGIRTRRAAKLAHDYGARIHEDEEGAKALLAELIGELGQDVVIRPPIRVDYGDRISIGEGTFINYNLTALDVAPIRIGRHCQLATNVQLLTPTHPLASGPRRDGVEGSAPITIGDNVWLGGGVIVLPGVTIGEHSVIGAGAVVTKDVPPYSLAVGNPARVIRRLD
ncbi:sugar O-acetyltransferase [Gulosibacter sp. 10]|uniref:sugar O-acetyltransferase n=1 Tax=Gulosibacter sp. 10 TaxID=1255570 RepID=UPI000B35886D|nr:sugar O-acetyltransferase [Gulosibacter sp. 10]